VADAGAGVTAGRPTVGEMTADGARLALDEATGPDGDGATEQPASRRAHRSAGAKALGIAAPQEDQVRRIVLPLCNVVNGLLTR